jgi:hypothetical protein
MKFTLASKDLKDSIKVATAILQYSGKTENKPCILRASEKGLEMETARGGATVLKLMPGQLLRAGEIGIDLEQLASLRSLATEVSLDAQQDKLVVKSGRSKFQIPVIARAIEDVAAQRVAKYVHVATATVPLGLLKSAALYAVYSTAADFRLQIKLDKGMLRAAGVDHVSGGRVAIRDHAEITATKSFEFVVPSELFGDIVDALDGKTCKISLSEQSGIVLLKSANLTVAHPILDQQVIQVDQHFDNITKNKVMTKALLENQALREGVDAVAPAAKTSDTTVLSFGKGKLKISAADEAVEATHLVKDPEVTGEPGEARVFYGHLASISKKLPPGLNVTLTLFDDKFLYLTAETEPLAIDYLIQQRAV